MGKRDAGNVGPAPDRQLAVPVLADDKGVHAAAVHLQMLSQQIFQAGSVQHGARADHPVGGASVSNTFAPEENAEATAPWYLLCTTRPVKPLIFQKRRDYALKRKDAPTDDNVFMRDEYLYGVDARVRVIRFPRIRRSGPARCS